MTDDQQPPGPAFDPPPQQQPGQYYGQQHGPSQGQPYGPYPPQPGYPPPGYLPPPGHRGGRGRTALIVIGSVLGSFVVIGVIAGIAVSGSHTVTTGQAATAPAPSTTAPPYNPAIAGVGSTIILAGNDQGEQVAVTVTRIVSHGQPADQFSTPDPGKRFYAVQFLLADIGSAAYSDFPAIGAVVVDSAGQSYQSAIWGVAGCQSFPVKENIAAGQSGLGCIAFEVPVGATITKVQFTLDSGSGPQTGQWEVSG